MIQTFGPGGKLPPATATQVPSSCQDACRYFSFTHFPFAEDSSTAVSTR